MDRYSKRERLGLVAIAIAALASAATSAKPTPTPDLMATKKGTVSVTAEAPVTWLDVSAKENEALIAAGGRTEVHVQGEPQDTGVLLFVGPPDGYIANGMGAVRGQAVCPAGEACGATVRLTVILLDPEAHPTVDVAWTATAESRFPPNSGPVPAAVLGVVVGAVKSAPAAAVGLTSTNTERIELGPNLPRAVRNVRLTLPAGPTPDAILDAGALLRLVDLDDRPGYQSPATIRVLNNADHIGGIGRGDLMDLLTPFDGCDARAPCEVDLSIEFDWNGGSEDASAIDWSLAAWPGVSTGEPTPASAITVLDPTDVVWDRPPLTASATGRSAVTRQAGARFRVTPMLDLLGVPQGEVGEGRELAGLVRVTLRAVLAPGTVPTAEVGVRIGRSTGELARASENLRPGQPLVVYSGVEDVVCGVRSARCGDRTTFDVVLVRASSDGPEAMIDWTVDVEFVPLTQDGVPGGAKLRIEVEAITP